MLKDMECQNNMTLLFENPCLVCLEAITPFSFDIAM